MYNMDISILGYKLNLGVLILIGVIYLIMVGHTVGGCCNGIMEGLTTNSAASLAQKKQNVKAKIAAKEGFVGANTNYGESSQYSLSKNNTVNTSSWMAPNMTVVPGQPLSSGVKEMLNRQPQPVPLPEGEMLMFANTPFKPECCPNSFSNSSGCACMTTEQYNYLILRGGNNVPYSEY